MTNILIDARLDIVSDSIRPVFDEPTVVFTSSGLEIQFQHIKITLTNFSIKTVDAIIQGLDDFVKSYKKGVGVDERIRLKQTF